MTISSYPFSDRPLKGLFPKAKIRLMAVCATNSTEMGKIQPFYI